MNLFVVAALAPLPVLLIAAAVTDVRRFIIPNRITLAVAASGLFAITVAIVFGDMTGRQAAEQLGVGAAALALGFGLFAMRIWGGGDGKLVGATALWFDPAAAVAFVLYTLLAGGALALVGLLLHANRFAVWSIPPLRALPLEQWKGQTPYGVAIAVGALIAFQQSVLFELSGF